MKERKGRVPIAIASLVAHERGKTATHIDSFDVLRVLAVAAVVWIHTMERGELGRTTMWCRFAVPAFTATSVFLMALSVKQQSPTSVIRYAPRRAWSIYRLFLVWNAIYFLARLIKQLYFGASHAIPLSISSLFIVGLVGHLWYLPFLTVLGVALVLPMRGFLGLTLVPAMAATGVLACAAVYASHLATLIQVDAAHHPLTYFGSLALSTSPAALFAFPIAWLWNRHGTNGDSIALTATSLFLAGLCLYVSLDSRQWNLWHNLAGVLLLIAALSCSRARFGRHVKRFGDLVLPVYLIHPLLVEGLHRTGVRLGVLPTASFDMLVFMVALLGSFLIAYFLSGNRWLSWSVSNRRIQRHKEMHSNSIICKVPDSIPSTSSGENLNRLGT
jgi:surface polysaccharide O-acyltransferase-like enzyme